MKVSMAGQPVGFFNRLASSWRILRCYRQGIFGNVEADITHHYEVCDIINSQLGSKIDEARILDLGCGQMAKQTLMFAADGSNVTGVDIEVPTYIMNAQIFLKCLTENGLERTFKSTVRHALFDRAYIRRLSLLYPKKIPYSELDIRIMSAKDLEFKDNHFDFIFSLVVFEHVDDIPTVLKEVNRCLKDSGVAYIFIHLFPSLSGGHHLDWIYPEAGPPTKVPPWDHLLENKYPVNTFLNKLRLDQYRTIFHDHMALIEEKQETEGCNILTPELSELLFSKGFSKEDLLTRTVTFICRKK